MVVSSGSGSSSLVKGAALLALGFLAFGCASEKSAVEKELDRLRAEVASLRTQSVALTERMGVMENVPRAPAGKNAAPAARTTGATENTPSSDRPELEVVKLGPESANVSEEAHTADAPAAAPTAQSSASTAAFLKAKGLLDKRKHDEALLALSEFITTFPDHERVPEATFLRAQCHAQKGDKKRTVEQLEAALAMSGGTDLTADVLFELSKARDKMGDPAGAKRARDRLRTEFSNSTAAKRLAR